MTEPAPVPACTATDVVVGCDGSEGCQAAMRYAIEEAARRHSDLVIVTAFERPVDPDLDSTETPEAEFEGRARAGAQRCLDIAAASTAPTAVRRRIVTTAGRPADALMEAACHAAVIIIGRQHTGTLQRAIFGSASRPLITGSPIPVIIVPHAYAQ